jgi:hypothetical protein
MLASCKLEISQTMPSWGNVTSQVFIKFWDKKIVLFALIEFSQGFKTFEFI